MSLADAEMVMLPLTVALLAGAVMETVGSVVSVAIVTDLLTGLDIFPTASLAHAYAVWLPLEGNVMLAGAVPLHVHPSGESANVMQRPVTATLSVAVKVVIGTVMEVEVDGRVNAVTVGA